MNNRPTTLERAFELAKSGACRGIADISSTLVKEGHHDARAQLYGRVLVRQLSTLCREARVGL